MNLTDVDLEWSVLGAMLADPRQVSPVLREVGSADFASERTRAVFNAIASVHSRGEVADAQLVATEMTALGTDRRDLISTLLDATAVPSNAPTHARRIRALSLMRAVQRTGQDIATLELGTDPAAVIAEAIDMLNAAGAALPSPDEGMAEMIDATERAIERSAQGELALATGMPSLDRNLGGGLLPGKLAIIGARPGVGKSALASNIVRRTLEAGRSVLFLSLEMTGREVLTRLVTERERLDKRDPNYYSRLLGAFNVDSIREWPLVFMGTGDLTTLARRARELRPNLVVVDYLQLLPSTSRHENRATEVAEFSRSLKLLAVALDIPVLACAQVNRAPEVGTKPRPPRLSDLRESGAIEADADIVILLHRDVEMGARETKLILAKNRDGQTGHIDCWLKFPELRFVETERGEASA